MSISGLATEPTTRAVRDETTRYLCAAAHLDPSFADDAIREFLTEPLRAIPPSPSIDAAAVLREAVAARARRQLRDWLLLVLLVGFGVANPGLAVAWLLVGLVLAFTSGGGPGLTATVGGVLTVTAGGRPGSGRRLAAIVGLGIAAVLFVLLTVPGVRLLLGGVGLGGLPSIDVGPVEVAFALLALVVVVLDEFALSYLLTRSFRRSRYVADPQVDTWPGEGRVRTLGRETHASQLRRIADADATGNVVVYRGYEPFIGSGTRYRPFSFAIPLEPAQDDEHDEATVDGGAVDGGEREPVPFTMTELYDHVAAELLSLRDSPSLAPSNRLAGLVERGQVIVPIEQLVINLADPDTAQVLPSLDEPPKPSISDEALAALAKQPLEWLRYYRCFRLETWGRDVTLSVYLHFGASDRMLYLEWTPCLLFPIADEYRGIDQLPDAPLAPLRHGIVSWVGLPAALLGRLGRLVRRIKPLSDVPGMVLPARYGTLYSLRELAASTTLNNYFQRSDIDRYLKVLERRMIRAVGTFLEDRDVSVTAFMEQASEVVTNNTYIAGDVTNSAVGNRNKVSGNQAGKTGQG